ncbi:MAG TPA: Nif3-like dinuclear metal center hexameric protein [Tepidisphaeraceae bacterium]|nr:Nif3-like dinuclear metal center hexameric protein [Tepidisphaeraceae bacterium]
MISLAELVAALDDIAPTRLAEAWDNVGLLAGDPEQAVTRAMLCIDLTPAVAAEAEAQRCDAVIAYHPPLFHAVKRLTAGSVIFDAIRRGVAIYSPHTALDVADGGTNDLLADALGISGDDRMPLRIIQPQANQYKLVTFVPEQHVERVAAAVFAAGAGRIGDYTQCSFRTPGTGTFFGEEGTNPVVGQQGTLERTSEIRIETVMPVARLNDVLAALRKSHPYEEPAFDLVQLATPPEKVGQGRVGPLASPAPRAEVLERIKRELGLRHLLIAGPTEGAVTRAACCAGSCGDFVDDAIAAGADLYLTGEMKHHDALKAAARGVTVVCTLHSNSERAVLKRLRARLAERLPQLAASLSQSDRDPFEVH